MIEEVEDNLPLMFDIVPSFSTRTNTWKHLFALVWYRQFPTVYKLYRLKNPPETLEQWFGLASTLLRTFHTQWNRLIEYTTPLWCWYEWDFPTRLWQTTLQAIPLSLQQPFFQTYTTRLSSIIPHCTISTFPFPIRNTQLPFSTLQSVLPIQHDWLVPMSGALAFVSPDTLDVAIAITQFVIQHIGLDSFRPTPQTEEFKRLLFRLLGKEDVALALLQHRIVLPIITHPYAYLAYVFLALIQYRERNCFTTNAWILSFVQAMQQTQEWEWTRSAQQCLHAFPRFAGKKQWIQQIDFKRFSKLDMLLLVCSFYPSSSLPSHLRFLGSVPQLFSQSSLYEQDLLRHTQRQFPNVYISLGNKHGRGVQIL